jgi:transposase
MNRRFELTDQEWARLAPLLPAMTPRRGGRWRDHRQVLNGILFRTAPGCPGGICPTGMGPGRRSTSGSRAGRPTGPGHASRPACRPRPTGLGSWTGTPRSTPASSALTSTPLGPATGDRVDPGKPPAGAGPVAGWADHQAAHHLRWPGSEPGHPADSWPGRRHQRVGGAGRCRAGGPAGWARPAADTSRSPDRG